MVLGGQQVEAVVLTLRHTLLSQDLTLAVVVAVELHLTIETLLLVLTAWSSSATESPNAPFRTNLLR
jgi:hypothetical protein